jgi:preprotein translocase subunit SecD
MKKVIYIIAIILGSFSIGISQIHSEVNQDTSNNNKVVNNRQVGFYLIAAEADSVAKLPAPSTEQRLVRYDYKFLRDTERGKPLYLLLPKKADVSLMLSKTPELKEKGENGFPEVRLELTSEVASKLEKLTREHLGGKVAFVIDDEPVTLHKIRSVITGGQFRLSRCTDTACQYIYGRLVEKR